MLSGLAWQVPVCPVFAMLYYLMLCTVVQSISYHVTHVTSTPHNECPVTVSITHTVHQKGARELENVAEL